MVSESLQGVNIVEFGSFSVSIDSLKASAEKAGIEVDEYIRLAKEALTGRLNPEGKQTVFKYDVAVDGTAKV